MKLDNGEFYILKADKNLSIFSLLPEAVSELKASKNDDAEILKFALDKSEKWAMSLVSWKEIGKLLLKEENDGKGTQN